MQDAGPTLALDEEASRTELELEFLQCDRPRGTVRQDVEENLRPRLHVSGSSGYPAPDRPFVYTYPGQMYAIRSITVRYPERFKTISKVDNPDISIRFLQV